MTPIFSKLTGFALYVQSIALLGAADAGHLEEGARAWTADQRDEWALAKSAPAGTTADGITVVAATGAGVGAFWIRQMVADPYWAYVTTWYVDPVAGSNNFTGASPATALQTMAELCRRLRYGTSNGVYTINVLNNVPVSDVFNPDVRQISGGAAVANSSGVVWYVVGQRNVTRSGTTAAGTTQTDPSAAAATAQAQITDAAIGWTASEGGLVVAANGDTAWVLSGKTNAVGSAGRVTDWRTSAFSFSGAPGTGGPGAGSAYNLTSLTTWRAQVQAGGWQTPANASPGSGNWSVVFQNLHFDDLGAQFSPFTGRTNYRFNTCKFSNQSTGTSSYGFTNGLSGGSRLFILGSMFQNYDNTFRSCFLGTVGQQITLSGGCGMRFTRLSIGSPAAFYITNLCLQGGYIDYGNNSIEPGGGIAIGSSGNGAWLGVYNDFAVGVGIVAALQLIKPYAQAALYGSFYGIGDGVTNIFGIRCDAGAKCSIKDTITEAAPTPATAFNFTPSVNGTQLSLDGLSATMPNITASAGAVLPATTDYRTFTLYRTTFARNAQNYGTGSAFLATSV